MIRSAPSRVPLYSKREVDPGGVADLAEQGLDVPQLGAGQDPQRSPAGRRAVLTPVAAGAAGQQRQGQEQRDRQASHRGQPLPVAAGRASSPVPIPRLLSSMAGAPLARSRYSRALPTSDSRASTVVRMLWRAAPL